jgi:hypothetical protein
MMEDEEFWKPNDGGQQGFMDDYTHRYIALAGGWFAGKTWAGARKLVDLHVYNAFHLTTGEPTFVNSAVIAPTYQLAQDFDIPEIRKALEETGLSYVFHGDKTKFKFHVHDLGSRSRPSEILVRTADAPERITGWTVGAVWGDEAARWNWDPVDPTLDPFIQADGRLRDPKANFLQFMLTFTHEGDSTRVYQDFEEDPRYDHVLYRAGSYENPHAAEFIKVQERQLSKDLATQYLQGIALSVRGNSVYPSWGPENISTEAGLVDNLPLQLSIDFNINPGMHAEIGQFDAMKPMAVTCFEIHERRMNTVQMLQAFKSWITKTGGWRWPKLEIFGDASKDTNAQNGKTNWDIVREWMQTNFENPWALRIPENNPSVADRVNAVNCAMRSMDGKVRYQVHSRCVNLIADYKKMRWCGNDIDKSDRKMSHASEADGYRIYRLLPIRRARFMGGKVRTFSQVASGETVN